MYFFAVLFALLTIATALGVVFCRSAMHSALYLVLTFFLFAIHYAILQSHFVAALQVMVYAGAIMVLVVFVIMLTGSTPSYLPSVSDLRGKALGLLSTIAGGVMLAALYEALLDSETLELHNFQDVPTDIGGALYLGRVLFSKYLFSFELISLLLLAAIIGSVVLAKEPRRKLPAGRGLKAMQELEQERSK